MKFILFCQNPYAFGILEPIMQVLKEKKHEYLWFITNNLSSKFPYTAEPHTSNIEDLKTYRSDAILCPGNEVPYYLRGLKVQIFHGLAGEKKGHFRIRHYFDLYLTQGPYFTKKFRQLQQKYKDFEVIETGWSKLDIYGKNLREYEKEKEDLLQEKSASKIILYAPTFSPSLTSAPFLLEEIKGLAENKEFLILIKFHDLMNTKVVETYRTLAKNVENVVVEEEPNIVKFLIMADIMISDTSSVVYEFLLLDKPVLTFRSSSQTIRWDNSREYKDLKQKVAENLEHDPYAEQRREIIADYHPYNDGKSSLRMVNAIEDYIETHGVPEKRKLSFLRRRKINRLFKE
ncbi:CDP-glycerol--glycerophosphate glycerophosphotransferase [Salinimicrobium marinum]|uniref:CDP-glycerol--glycerophosphate glycerophosphotransferase n=1 Tax=Salinimicrobium marinum TaxID=680283 RepID=A0A918W060_9FLAO|nr:CDP-glycerol glycerophosphotransferase family protein [Salinimicrobium marinum]GHA43904.1 CDP-glycerol--glycerophosphate glycerophosphotransferase [Salinimicrobium marinum]